MKKLFETPEVTIELISYEDILTASGDPEETEGIGDMGWG